MDGAAATSRMLRKPGQGAASKKKGGDAYMADTIDILTERLTDLSNHARIDVGGAGGGGGAAAVDFATLPLKPDHDKRPFWVTPTGAIFLEATSPLYEQARDFLVAICEPVSRPEFIHEYRLDKNALFAAASMGLTSDIICSALNRLSKVPVSQTVLDFVHACTTGYGKVKLLLQKGKYYLESSYPAILRLLNRHPSIRAARIVYLPDGSRRVGLDGPTKKPGEGGEDDADDDAILLDDGDEEDAEYAPKGAGGKAKAGGGKGVGGIKGIAASAEAYGFEVSTAASEAEGSLGLRGIVSKGGEGATELSGLLKGRGVGGDTAGGTLTRRVIGEVDSDEEDDSAVADAALRAMIGGPGAAALAGSGGAGAGLAPIGAGAGSGAAYGSQNPNYPHPATPLPQGMGTGRPQTAAGAGASGGGSFMDRGGGSTQSWAGAIGAGGGGRNGDNIATSLAPGAGAGGAGGAANAGGGVSTPANGFSASSSGADIFSAFAEDFSRLNEEDIASLVDAVTQAEATAAAEERLLSAAAGADGAGGAGSESSAKLAALSAFSAATGATTGAAGDAAVGGATKLSFRGDVARMLRPEDAASAGAGSGGGGVGASSGSGVGSKGGLQQAITTRASTRGATAKAAAGAGESTGRDYVDPMLDDPSASDGPSTARERGAGGAAEPDGGYSTRGRATKPDPGDAAAAGAGTQRGGAKAGGRQVTFAAPPPAKRPQPAGAYGQGDGDEDEDEDDYAAAAPDLDIEAAIAEDQGRIDAENAALAAVAAVRTAQREAAREAAAEEAAAAAAGKQQLQALMQEMDGSKAAPGSGAAGASAGVGAEVVTAQVVPGGPKLKLRLKGKADGASAPANGTPEADAAAAGGVGVKRPRPDEAPSDAAGAGAPPQPKKRQYEYKEDDDEDAGNPLAAFGGGGGSRTGGVKRGGGAAGGGGRRKRRGSDEDSDDDDDEDYTEGGGGGGGGGGDDSDFDSDDDGFSRRRKGGRGRGRGGGGRGGGGRKAADGGLGGARRAGGAGSKASATAASGAAGGAGEEEDRLSGLQQQASAEIFAHVASTGAASLREFQILYKRLHTATSLQQLHTPGRVERFEIEQQLVDEVKKVCLFLDPPLPLIQEYDFRHDAALPKLAINLRDPSALRPYQEKSLAKMFGNGRARSGIIVLPCGAGKTFVGISAATTIGKSTIILCPNQTSVGQWVEQLYRFTDVSQRNVCVLTAKRKEQLPPLHEPVVLLTTYTMIGSGGRSAESAAIMRAIATREWGCMLLDEVHQAVANTFSKALRLRAHCRLGLTATLVREDGRDKRLSLFIGPKLYEANWMDLTRGGYLANVQVAEVWCPVTPEFYHEYLTARSIGKKKALAVMNPVKCAAMDYLIRKHDARGDKIIIFSESVFALRLYAEQYKVLAIEGATPPQHREAFIKAFKTPDSGVNKLFLSRVGDVALDVPDANVIIQISSHFGSRLQEAQRMGRILRRGTASNAISGQNAFFYTLVSTDTLEVYFANKRRRYLVDQGYAYKVLMADKLALYDRDGEPAPASADAGGEGAGAGGVGAGAGPSRGGSSAHGAVAASFNLEAEGLTRLFARAAFMSTREQQQKVLEAITLENVDEEEGKEDKLAAEFVSEEDLRRFERDKRAAVAASSAGSAGGGAMLDAAAASSVLPPTRFLPTAAKGTKVSGGAGRGAGAAGPSLLAGSGAGGTALPPTGMGGPGAGGGGGGLAARAVQHSGLDALTGGAGISYLEYTSERSGFDALREAEAVAAAERRALAQAAAAARATGGAGAGGAGVGAAKAQPASSAAASLLDQL